MAVATGDRAGARRHLTASLELMVALGHPEEPDVRGELAALDDPVEPVAEPFA